MADERKTPQRLTRAEAKARTREQLLDAAADVFARNGYAGASVDEIAEAAGYSTGALYSNFASKEELFLELMSAWRSRGVARQADMVAEVLSEEGADLLSLLSQRLEHVTGRSTQAATLQAEFWLYAVRNPDAMRVLAAKADERITVLTPLVTHVMREYGASPPVPPVTPEHATRIMLALFQGLARQRRIDPKAVPADLLPQALHWLLTGMGS